MRYGIIATTHIHTKNHVGLVSLTDGAETLKLSIINKYNSTIHRGRNKKLFQDLLKLLNKYYDIEDLNKKNKSHLTLKQYKKIKRGTL